MEQMHTHIELVFGGRSSHRPRFLVLIIGANPRFSRHRATRDRLDFEGEIKAGSSKTPHTPRYDTGVSRDFIRELALRNALAGQI